MAPTTPRDRQRQQFVERSGWGTAHAARLPQDASTRCYIRLQRSDRTGDEVSALLMDAPQGAEDAPLRADISITERWQRGYTAAARLAGSDLTAFSAITQALRHNGIHAPQIFATDPVNGFALIEDLGDDLFAHVMARAAAHGEGELIESCYRAALEMLVHLQAHITDAAQIEGHYVAPYDDTALMAEALLLPEWYGRFSDAPPIGADGLAAYRSLCQTMFDPLSKPHTLVLRDFHAENILWHPERVGHDRVAVIDFQDALIGHAAYDVVSLLEDARRTVSPELQSKLLDHYRTAKAVAQPGFDEAQFGTDYAILAAQRNAKILGIFARLIMRDGKEKYRHFMPVVQGYFAADLNRPAAAPLKGWVTRYMPSLLEPPE